MKHPQADLIMQVAAIRAEGMCEHYKYQGTESNSWADFDLLFPLINSLNGITIRMKPSHPDYNTDKNPHRTKPVLKQIDMSRLPVGTMTNYGKILVVTPSTYILYESIDGKSGLGYWSKFSDSIRLAEQTEWTAWTGGECPVPEGCEYQWISGYGIVYYSLDTAENWGSLGGAGRVAAYRITGIAEGYTDGSL
jgi:hypothetical protein